MSKGQFGARDLHKHLWKMPIPEHDARQHAARRQSPRPARRRQSGAARELADLRENRGTVTVTIARRELRKWLQTSLEGQAVEAAVAELLP